MWTSQAFWSTVIGLLGAGAAVAMAIVNAMKARSERRNTKLSVDGLRYHDMIENAHDSILRVNSDNRIIIANRQARLITQYGNDLIGMNVNALVPASLRVQHQIDVKKYVRNPRSRMMGKVSRPLALLTKRGDEIQAEISLTPGEPIDNGPEVTVVIRPLADAKMPESAEGRAIMESN